DHLGALAEVEVEAARGVGDHRVRGPVDAVADRIGRARRARLQSRGPRARPGSRTCGSEASGAIPFSGANRGFPMGCGAIFRRLGLSGRDPERRVWRGRPLLYARDASNPTAKAIPRAAQRKSEFGRPRRTASGRCETRVKQEISFHVLSFSFPNKAFS